MGRMRLTIRPHPAPRSRVTRRIALIASTACCTFFLFAGIGATLSTPGSPPQWPGALAMFAIAALFGWSIWFSIAMPERGSPMAVAAARLRRRETSRQLLAKNPALAAELHVGRPDLHGPYDDGGLIDVNHVPAAVLAATAGLTLELAGRIVEAREKIGRFESTADLEVLLDLGPHDLDECRDLLVFG